MLKISRIEFFNHYFFGNKVFDFTSNGETAENIIFAGENGTGKTKLLEELNKVFKTNIFIKSDFKIQNTIIKIYINLEDCHINKLELSSNINKMVLYVNNYAENEYNVYCKFYNSEDVVVKQAQEGKYIKLNINYSNVDINYNKRGEIKSITNKRLDDESDDYKYENNDLAYELQQLLIDIVNEDNADMAECVRRGIKNIPEESKDRRMKRFLNAYRHIFKDELRFVSLENNTIPIFEKNGSKIKIDQLSSGEKQIIYRGLQILRNKELLKEVPLLVDEPEISMHPKWEKNIFNYYHHMICENDKQESQLFVATHSEHVLESAYQKKNTIIIKMNSNNEEYKDISNDSILPTLTLGEIKYLVFDVYTIDFHIALYSFIRNTYIGTDKNVRETDDWLSNENTFSKRKSQYKNTVYNTLQTYIRNAIDHPDEGNKFTDEELKKSIDEMVKFIRENKE